MLKSLNMVLQKLSNISKREKCEDIFMNFMTCRSLVFTSANNHHLFFYFFYFFFCSLGITINDYMHKHMYTLAVQQNLTVCFSTSSHPSIRMCLVYVLQRNLGKKFCTVYALSLQTGS